MPVVRKYERQITPSAAPTARRSEYQIAQLQTPPPRVAATGGPAGAAQFGATIASIGEQLYARELEKQNQVKTLDARKQVGQAVTKMLYDPETGALNIRGQAAFGLHDKVGKDLGDVIGKVRKGLANDRQRIAFDAYADQVLLDTGVALDKHVATERYRVDSEALEGFKANEIQAAIADPNPERAEVAAGNLKREYDQYGKRWGKAPEETQAATAKAVSDVYEQRIWRYLDNNQGMEAQVTYDEHKDEILGSQRGKIEAAVYQVSTLGKAQEVVDTLKLKYTDDVTQTELEDEIPKLTNKPEVRQQAESILRTWFAQKRADTNFREGQAAKAAKAKMDEVETQIKNTMDRASRNLAYEQVVPQSVRDLLPESVEKAQREYWKLITESKKVETDPGVYRKLMLMSAKDPDGFVAEHLEQYLPQLDTTDYKKFNDLQASLIRKEDADANKTIDGILTHERIIDSGLRSIGIDPSDKANKTVADQLWKAVGKRVDSWQSNNGKKATDDVIQTIVDSEIENLVFGEPRTYLPTGPILGGVFGIKIPVPFTGDQVTKPAFQVTIHDIPPDDRKQAEAELRRAQQPVTDATILDLFIRTQQRLQKKK